MPSAIKPDSFSEIRKIIAKAEAPQDPELVKEKQLAVLADLEGWQVLKDYINSISESLANLNKSMMEAGASFEEIGKNTVVAQLAGDLLNKVIHKVEDAQDSVRNTK